ncbi:2-C-methyl-D-erythritol 4-phosphate cytidylyltransferase [Pseudonocardia thermophila]|uniref:2-C-methyl-D-erythritol 4-phosphate cytidylyltransferase n=1 Tax=Pseudonocardia thermophila TaxID=1848 RepID=A0A1M6UNK7_PSETH|nr:2-C-methyl-D-erythritol 4-phosphate cytidylyltransferase [Pseudonocardia thermophila]SHK70766.1 2-C-methyl-D-erythritol 4-phosphate cytidylyltransferase [Pseudonocardia thermophila]
MDVVAAVVCNESDVDPLTPVGGIPLLVRAVETLLGADELSAVHVLTAADHDPARVLDACADLPVVIRSHPLQRPSRARGDGVLAERWERGAADVVVVHELTWALVTRDVLPRVLAGVAAGQDAVVPVVPLTDTVKDVTPSGLVVGTPDRASLRVVQSPQAFRAAVLDPADPLPSFGVLAAAGVIVHSVPGDPAALPLRTADDVALAGAVIRGGPP